MSGETATVLFVVLLAVAATGLPAWRALRAWQRARDVRLVPCPETGQPAAVAIDAGHAAFTAFIEGAPHVRLASCSRWESRGRCDEPCVPDVEERGRAAAVNAIARRWFADKTCALCCRPVALDALAAHHPALIDARGVTVEWSDVEPERLPALFETHQPVCWSCHVAETFRRRFPELVVDRPARPAERA